MIFTENKPIEEILEALGNANNIYLLACNGCAESSGTGGENGLLALKTELEKAGKTITGSCIVDFLCNKVLVTSRISRHMEKIDRADSVLVLSCGIGVQSAARIISRPVHPSANTVSLGGIQGLWPSDERCGACGDCALAYTGGICPITSCAKSLLNGPCGGTDKGKCEVDSEKDCGWSKIYEKLEKTGRLENLKKVYKARDHSRMLPSRDLRNTRFYDVEV